MPLAPRDELFVRLLFPARDPPRYKNGNVADLTRRSSCRAERADKQFLDEGKRARVPLERNFSLFEIRPLGYSKQIVLSVPLHLKLLKVAKLPLNLHSLGFLSPSKEIVRLLLI